MAKSKEIVQTAANDPERQTALVPMQPQQSNTWTACRNLQDALQIAQIIGSSPTLPDVRNVATALLKILAGAEMGFGAFASLTNVHIIDGRPSIGAHLMAAAIKRSGRYDYDVLERTRERCEIEFFSLLASQRKSLGKIAMTFEEAKSCGVAIGKSGVKKNWETSSDDMLFARCIGKGYRSFCPDLSGGVLTYDSDELDQVEPRQIVGSFVPPTSPGVEMLQAKAIQDAVIVQPDEETAHVDENGEVILPNARPSPTGEQFTKFDNLCLALKTKPATLEKKYAELGVRAFVDLSPSQADTLIGQMQAALAKQMAADTAKRAGQKKEETTVPA